MAGNSVNIIPIKGRIDKRKLLGVTSNDIDYYKLNLIQTINYSNMMINTFKEREIKINFRDSLFFTLKLHLTMLDNLYDKTGGFFKIQEDKDDSYYIPELWESLSENLYKLLPRLGDNVYGEYIKGRYLMYKNLVHLIERTV